MNQMPVRDPFVFCNMLHIGGSINNVSDALCMKKTQKNKEAAIEKPLFVVQGCLEMNCSVPFATSYFLHYHKKRM